jgi:hypothetical protein
VFRYPRVISRFRSALAFALGLWCAGAGCMMVSYARATVMDNSDIPVTKSTGEDASSSMGSHACCKARRTKSKRNRQLAISHAGSLPSAVIGFRDVVLPLQSTPPDAVSCCPLTSGSFVQSRSSSSYDEDSQVSPPDALFFAFAHSEVSLRGGPPYRLSQDRTYLACCAFLI